MTAYTADSMTNKDIKLKILGGGREIGANCYLLEWGEYKIMLDCGLDPRKRGYGAIPALDILRNDEVDAVIISHAHSDHIGSLPFLIMNYCKLNARVYMSIPCRELIPHMLLESVKVVERERIPKEEQYYYHQFFDRYLVKDLKKQNSIFDAREFGIWFELLPGLTAMFFPSGHILGSAGVVITDGHYTFVYTGDLSISDNMIHPGCRLPDLEKVDCLVIESTHGSTMAPQTDPDEEIRRLASEISATIERGGHVLIPAFGLGRTQELAVILSKMKKEGLIPDVPVFYHAGMTAGVNMLYDKFSKYLVNMEETRLSECFEMINAYEAESGKFKPVSNLSRKPAIFLFTSGMMNRKSPSAMLAAQLIKSEKHGIFFCGYIAPNDLGYELANVKTGQSVCVDLDNNLWVKVVCPHIDKFSFSGHAERDELIKISSHFNPSLSIWVHGDPSSTEWLARKYRENNPAAFSYAPGNRETIVLRLASRVNNIPMRKFRAILVTVGTSLLSTYLGKSGIKQESAENVTENDIHEYIIKNIDKLPSLCAETNSLNRKGLEESDILYFLCGDNPQSILCGNILTDLYKQSHHCRMIRIQGLRPDARAFQESGMKNLIEKIVEIIEDHGGNAVMHATGGFKAQIAVATMMGILFKCKVYYLYEDFNELVSLPEVPLDFDFQAIVAHKDSFFTLLDGRRYWDMDEIYSRLPDNIRLCFYKDDIQKKYHLTPLGRSIFSSFQRYLGKKSQNVPVKVNPPSSLWGTEYDSMGKILNPAVGIIMERLNRFGELIKEFEFSSKRIEKKAHRKTVHENYFELVKSGNDFLVYTICHSAELSGIQDILTVKTSPGASAYLKEMLGQKVYP